MKDTILVVDDMDINRDILVDILQDEYYIIQASNGYEAVEAILRYSDDLSLVLMDIMMPKMDGLEVLGIMRAGGYVERVPVIIITATGGDDSEIKCLSSGAVDYLEKPFHPDIVRCRVRSQIALKHFRNRMEELVEKSVQKVISVRDSMIDVLASVIEYRHCESGQHVRRTRTLADQLMKNIKLSNRMNRELNNVNLSIAAKTIPLHDIGKIGIPDHILLKPGKLTVEEFEIIKQHTTLGAEIINTMHGIEDEEYLRYCHDICLYHHEQWDGKGYPKGLSGKDIPFSARVMALVDVYDALTSDRVYKPAFSHEASIEIIREDLGRKFDPVMGEIFINSFSSQIPSIAI